MENDTLRIYEMIKENDTEWREGSPIDTDGLSGSFRGIADIAARSGFGPYAFQDGGECPEVVFVGMFERSDESGVVELARGLMGQGILSEKGDCFYLSSFGRDYTILSMPGIMKCTTEIASLDGLSLTAFQELARDLAISDKRIKPPSYTRFEGMMEDSYSTVKPEDRRVYASAVMAKEISAKWMTNLTETKREYRRYKRLFYVTRSDQLASGVATGFAEKSGMPYILFLPHNGK